MERLCCVDCQNLSHARGSTITFSLVWVMVFLGIRFYSNAALLSALKMVEDH